MKIRFLLITMILFPALAWAQQGSVTGTVVTRQGRNPIENVEITLESAKLFKAVTDSEGRFTFLNIPEGVYDMRISDPDWQRIDMRVTVDGGRRDMGMISLVPDVVSQAVVDEFDVAELDFETGDVQSMPTILSASQDVFDNVAGYKFSSIRFRTRGYESGMAGVYLNGIYFNDAMTGYTPWSLWSGLNNVTRNQEITTGSAISDYGVGGVNGTTNINARASQIRKGFNFSAVNASGQYRLRLMATYGSGVLDNGWSYAFSASTRQGGNDWVKGTYYNSWAYFASVEKKINPQHSLALTFFATPGERAVQGASTQEVYDLVGSNYYNPNWGYQDGKNARDRRNARVRDNHEPVAMLNYYFTPNDKTQFNAAVAFRFGYNGYSALEWYDGNDPRPDYYRNLPSYYLRPGEYYNPELAERTRYGWLTDWNIRQINWQEMYNRNWNSYFSDDGTQYFNGVDPSGKRQSQYIIEDRRTDQRDLNVKLQMNTELTRRSSLNAGFDLRVNRTQYFKKVKDLLGGDYYLDIDKYAEEGYLNESQRQNDIDRPNRLVKKGDRFGYDYYAHLQSQKFWAIYKLNLPQWEITLAGETGNTRFWREGNVRKGLFPDNSYGNSEKQNFWTYTAKLGVNYRITGSHSVYANFSRIQAAPYFNNSFVSPRTRNSVAPNLTAEKITSVDVNYAVNSPVVRARLTGFYTKIEDRMDLISFYDDTQRSFTNFSMSGIDQMHTGLELGVAVPITQSFTANGVLSYGYYKYTSNPMVTQTIDNSNEVLLSNELVRWKDMKVESTPQTAVSLGIDYRGPNSIFAGIDFNYFNAMYLSMNPLYRTDGVHVNLTPEESQAMAAQEKFSSAFVLNANAGKMWRLRGGYTLGLNVSVNNILNDKEIKTGGYEQMRVYKETDMNTDISKYRRFDSKYYYMYGTTYYLQVYLRF